MRRGFTIALCALLALGFDAAQSVGADATSSVRIALLDMSAVVGAGRGYTQGSPNAAGAGGQYNPGMMGYANPGYGMMGGGMMGQGMMAIRADQTSVKSGTITFDITNWSRSVVHEVVIVAVDSPDAPLPYDYNKLKVPEEQVKVVGDSGELAPNASNSVKVELASGSYILMCNVPGHYAAGMAVAVTVMP